MKVAGCADPVLARGHARDNTAAVGMRADAIINTPMA